MPHVAHLRRAAKKLAVADLHSARTNARRAAAERQKVLERRRKDTEAVASGVGTGPRRRRTSDGRRGVLNYDGERPEIACYAT